MVLVRHAAPLRPPVQADLARDDVGVEESARFENPRHLCKDHRGLAEVLEQPAREHDVKRSRRERQRTRIAEEGVALNLRAAVVLANRPDRVRGVVERDEAIWPLAPEADKEPSRACTDLDRDSPARQQRPKVGDLRLVDEVEDVALGRVVELAVADWPIPRGSVALAVAGLVLVVSVAHGTYASPGAP